MHIGLDKIVWILTKFGDFCSNRNAECASIGLEVVSEGGLQLTRCKTGPSLKLFGIGAIEQEASSISHKHAITVFTSVHPGDVPFLSTLDRVHREALHDVEDWNPHNIPINQRLASAQF